MSRSDSVDTRLNLVSFKPGQSGNPGGKPEGARNRLTKRFLNDLCDDFEEHGKKAIAICRIEDPAAYVRAVAALMPKEVILNKPLDDIADDELAASIDYLRCRLAQSLGEGAVPTGEPQSVN